MNKKIIAATEAFRYDENERSRHIYEKIFEYEADDITEHGFSGTFTRRYSFNPNEIKDIYSPYKNINTTAFNSCNENDLYNLIYNHEGVFICEATLIENKIVIISLFFLCTYENVLLLYVNNCLKYNNNEEFTLFNEFYDRILAIMSCCYGVEKTINVIELLSYPDTRIGDSGYGVIKCTSDWREWKKFIDNNEEYKGVFKVLVYTSKGCFCSRQIDEKWRLICKSEHGCCVCDAGLIEDFTTNDTQQPCEIHIGWIART